MPTNPPRSATHAFTSGSKNTSVGISCSVFAATSRSISNSLGELAGVSVGPGALNTSMRGISDQTITRAPTAAKIASRALTVCVYSHSA